MNKWIKTKDRLGKEILQLKLSDSSFHEIPLPITIAGKIKSDINLLELYRFREKYSRFKIQWDKLHAEALDGKKIKVTIEVIE